MGSHDEASNDVERTVEQIVDSKDAPKKRRKTSPVWEDFDIVEGRNFDDNRERAKCTHCGRVYLSDSKLGTTNLQRHLDQCSRRPADCNKSATGYKKIDQEIYREKLDLAVIRHDYSFS